MIRVLGNRVLVALPPKEAETVTESGLVLMRDPERKQQTRGVVVALGERRDVVELDDVLSKFFEQRRQFEEMARVYATPYFTEVFDDMEQKLSTMRPAPFDVALGDVVLFPASAGEELRDGEIDYVILHESEILGVLEPLQKEVA